MSFQHVFIWMHRREEERGFCQKKIKKVRFALDKTQENVLPYDLPLMAEWDIGLSTKMNGERGCKQKLQVFAGLARTARKTGITALQRDFRGYTLPGPQKAIFSPHLFAQQSHLENERGGRGNATDISSISYSRTFSNPIVCKP